MDDSAIGTVDLNATNRLVFTLTYWKGRQYANVRKFVSSPKYSGPTKSGLALPGEMLVNLTQALEQLQAEVPGAEQREHFRLPKRDDVNVVVATVPPDDLKSLPSVDIREHIDTPEYTGPTKKGIRFSWDKLPEVVALLKTLARQMATEESQQRPLFPDAKPEWVEQATGTGDSEKDPKSSSRDKVLAELVPNGFKKFPDCFLDSASGSTRTIELPSEPLEVVQQPDGKYVVRSDFGYRHDVRNEIEGNYILYTHLRGHRTVQLPEAMINIFKAVKAYENYLRDLRHALLQAYERKSGYRPVAEHQTQEVFKAMGLPWV